MLNVRIKEVVEIVIRNHPSDCIFLPGTPERIAAEMWSVREFNEEAFDILERKIIENEVYCPHEGIDKLDEHGLGHLRPNAIYPNSSQ